VLARLFQTQIISTFQEKKIIYPTINVYHNLVPALFHFKVLLPGRIYPHSALTYINRVVHVVEKFKKKKKVKINPTTITPNQELK